MSDELAYQLALAWERSGKLLPLREFLQTPEADAVRKQYA